MIYEDIHEIEMTEAENLRDDLAREAFYEDYTEYLPDNGVQDIRAYVETLTETLRELDIDLAIEVYAENNEDGTTERIDTTESRTLEVIDTELDRANGKIYINAYTV